MRLEENENVTVVTNEDLETQETEEETNQEEHGDDETVSEENSEENDSQDSETEEDDEENEPKRPKNGFKKRIDRFKRKLDRKDEEIEYWRQQALKREKEETQKEEPSSNTQQTGRPSPDEYDSEDEYFEALTDWKVEERFRKLEEKNEQKKTANSQKELAQAWQERLSKFTENTPDFEEVIEEVEDIEVPTNLQQAIFESENGPAVMYEMAKRPELIERFAGLSAYQTGIEIGKIEARLGSKTKKKTTKAPPPVSTTTRGSAKVTKDPNKMSFKEYEAWRAEQMKKKGGHLI